ncbi:MAG: hypothetical protein II765_02405, partial [Lachnospiraceae bacterium]|nr:hypothetical protein [Lachnospiraceae bacterium]
GATFTMSGDSKILDNKNMNYGAGIYLYYNNCKLVMKGGEISGNIAVTHGGAVYMHDLSSSSHSDMQISGSSYIPYGGAVKNNDIYMLDFNAKITITGSLSDREANNLIYIIPHSNPVGKQIFELASGVSETEINKFALNTANVLIGNDGKIYNSNITNLSYPLPEIFSKIPEGCTTPISITLSEDVSITPGEFDVTYFLTIEGHYQLSSVSGYIFNVQDGGKLTIKDGVSLHSTNQEPVIKQSGGEIVIEGTASNQVTIDSQAYGDAVKIEGGTFNASYINISASSYWPLEISGGQVTIDNMTISGNSHPMDGGGVYIENGTIQFTNCSITNNTSSPSGGQSSKGGGIYMDNGNLTLNSCTITGNKVGYYNYQGNENAYGGGIYVNAGSININSCTISDNSELNNSENIEGKQIYLKSGVTYNGQILTSAYSQD